MRCGVCVCVCARARARVCVLCRGAPLFQGGTLSLSEHVELPIPARVLCNLSWCQRRQRIVHMRQKAPIRRPAFAYCTMFRTTQILLPHREKRRVIGRVPASCSSAMCCEEGVELRNLLGDRGRRMRLLLMSCSCTATSLY